MDLSLKNIFLLITILPTLTLAYPNGKVEAACSSMVPNHQSPAQTTAPPYSLTFSSTNYTGKLAFLITLSKEQDGMDFKGFMIQARAPNHNTCQGTFVVNSSVVQTLTCTTPASAVSHTSRDPKSSVLVLWVPPDQPTSSIQFSATVVKSFKEFWTNVVSDILPLASAGSQLMIPTLFQLLICSFTLIHAFIVK